MLRRAFFTLLSLAVLAGAGRAQSPNQWVRYCGKEDKEGPNVCITKYVHSETFSRMPIFSVALRDTRLDSKETRHFTVSVPLGVLLPPGIGVTFAPGDRWEQVAKTGNLEEGDKVRVWSFETKYTHCNVLGCVAEVEATQEILAGLQTSGGLIVHAANAWGHKVNFTIPLAGFTSALKGAPLPLSQLQEWEASLAAARLSQRQTSRAKKRMRCDEADWPGCAQP
jgi:invasion protein IalB